MFMSVFSQMTFSFRLMVLLEGIINLFQLFYFYSLIPPVGLYDSQVKMFKLVWFS